MNPFPGPMIFVAWGITPPSQGDRFKTATELRDWAKASGFKTLALQAGFCTREDTKTLQDAGLFVVLWGDVGASFAQTVADIKPNGVMPQVEGPGQFDGCVAALQALNAAGNTLPRAVVTTYWGLYDPTNDTTIRSGSKWKTLAALGVKAAFVECYAADAASHANLDAMLGQGQVYGIPKEALFATCGTYRGEMPASYTGLEALGRDYAVYLAEPMSGAQWTAWGAVNKVTTVNYWQVIDKATGRVKHEERAATWLDPVTLQKVNGLSLCLLYMEQSKDDIRVSGDFELKRVSH